MEPHYLIIEQPASQSCIIQNKRPSIVFEENIIDVFNEYFLNSSFSNCK